MPGNGSYMIHRFRGEAAEEHVRRKKGPERGSRRCRFSIGSAPLTSITKIDAQVRGGETRQDYKDTRRFPLEAPSCALLFRPCRLPDTCPPFSLREAWRFLIAHAVGISVRCRSFAPSWAVCTNPPFSPTAAPYPVTIVLSPTRKRHDLTPLAAAIGNWRFAGIDL